MLISVIAGINSTSQLIGKATSEAEKAGATIGSGIGFMFTLLVWAIGDIITGLLALLTRPKA